MALRPGELPATAEPAPYLRSAAALEAIGHYGAAVRAYEGALERWPENTMALLGLANARYGTGDLPAAESAYRKVLELEPTHVIALNNLAQTLADQQCYGEAADIIELALAQVGEESAVLDSLALTRDRIRTEGFRSPAGHGQCASLPGSPDPS